MQATGTFRTAGFSKGFVLALMAIVCALLLGGAGGYLARSVDTAASTPAHTQTVVESNQGGPDSDLTRALPTAAPSASEPQPDYGAIP
jgi:hypothetical protein